MPEYQVFVKKSAEKEIAALPLHVVKAVYEILEQLVHNPRPSGVKKLAGHQNLYRVRISNYRVIYSIEDKQLVIYVLKVGHRKDVYQ